MSIRGIELQRQALQEALDAQKSKLERNRLGQFATPPTLAKDILCYAKGLLPRDARVRFLEPAIGTGSFYSALLETFSQSRVDRAVGYELDPLYGNEAAKLWQGSPLELILGDFTKAEPPLAEKDKFNLLIANPPYVRHHHLAAEDKLRLQTRVEQLTGIRLSQLAGLYCHFLLLAHAWLQEDGLAAWLIPGEFMDVNYGREIKRYLLEKVTLLHIHRFDPKDVQFADALVSSVVVWFRKAAPPKDRQIIFTYGGTLEKPQRSESILAKSLAFATKWTQSGASPKDSYRTRLGDLFDIKRGLVTGDNGFFILSKEQAAAHRLPIEFLLPILPSPRYLPDDEIKSDEVGEPLLDRKFYLLSCPLPIERIKAHHPDLWRYLQLGLERGVHERYLCRHRRPWYSQEQRPATSVLCTYMGRQHRNHRPFRFILNHSKATAANVYLMLYPKGPFKAILEADGRLWKEVWLRLGNLPLETLLSEGRVYGGGLHKLEPRELANVSAESLAAILPVYRGRPQQPGLFDESVS